MPHVLDRILGESRTRQIYWDSNTRHGALGFIRPEILDGEDADELQPILIQTDYEAPGVAGG